MPATGGVSRSTAWLWRQGNQQSSRGKPVTEGDLIGRGAGLLGHCLSLIVPLVSRALYNPAWQPWQQPWPQSKREAAAVLCMPLTDSLSTDMFLTDSLSTGA